MSAAQELRDAAARLRTLAEKATPGPWTDFEPETLPGTHFTIRMPDEPLSEATSVATITTDTKGSSSNAALIAAMHPGVALALADVLESSAVDVEFGWVLTRTTRLARLINGGVR